MTKYGHVSLLQKILKMPAISTAKCLLWEWGIVENHSCYKLLEVKDQLWLHSEEGWGSCPGKPSSQSACVWIQWCLHKEACKCRVALYFCLPYGSLFLPSLPRSEDGHIFKGLQTASGSKGRTAWGSGNMLVTPERNSNLNFTYPYVRTAVPLLHQ